MGIRGTGEGCDVGDTRGLERGVRGVGTMGRAGE